MSNSLPNPILSLIVFTTLTTLYSIINYILVKKINNSNISDSDKDSKIIQNKSTIFYIYFFLLILSQIFTNLEISTNYCGNPQWSTIILGTLVPWIFIFFLIKILLNQFVGWYKPFENTFGYLAMKLMGINQLAEEIIKVPNKTDNMNESTKNFISQFDNDKSLVFNEISINNFQKFLNESDLLKKSLDNVSKNKLMDLLHLKRFISEYIWYILSGMLSVSLSYNFMISNKCEKSTSQLERIDEDIQENNNLNNEINLSEPEQRIYTSYE